jgi:hypothetical protein
VPTFYFRLKNGRYIANESEAEVFSSEAEAQAYGCLIARDLMRHREAATRSWRLQICNQDRIPVSEILFASIDESLAHCPANLRLSIERVSKQTASLSDTIADLRVSLLRMQATLARADKALHLAALDGARV